MDRTIDDTIQALLLDDQGKLRNSLGLVASIWSSTYYILYIISINLKYRHIRTRRYQFRLDVSKGTPKRL